MAIIEGVTRTRGLGPVIFRLFNIDFGGVANNTEDTYLFDKSLSAASALSGVDWVNKGYHGAKALRNLFGGFTPNGVRISPWGESGMVDNATFCFEVYAWKQHGAKAKEVCSCSATIGSQKFIYRVPLKNGPEAAGGLVSCVGVSGGAYVDTLAVTDRWYTGVTPTDHAGNGGQAGISFDLCGAEYLAIQVASAGQCSNIIGFEIEGW